VDPCWPKPLPEGWVTGHWEGSATDSHDDIVVFIRRNLTAEEAENYQQAPSIIMLCSIESKVPSGHGEIPTWSRSTAARLIKSPPLVGGHNDGTVQKYSHDGML
jgi:hypothetical protein